MPAHAQTTHDTFWEIANNIMDNKPFYYVRFGDGEFMVMDRKPIPQCEEVIERQSKEMEKSFDIADKAYMKAVALLPLEQEYGMEKGVFWEIGYHEYILKVLEKFKWPSGCSYPNQIALHYYAKFRGKIFNEFINCTIKPRTKLFIGSYNADDLIPVLGNFFNTSIRTARKCAYKEIDTYMDRLYLALGGTQSQYMIISACGVVSNIIAKRLWNKGYRDITFLDFGSLVDYMAGNKIRAWM